MSTTQHISEENVPPLYSIKYFHMNNNFNHSNKKRRGKKKNYGFIFLKPVDVACVALSI